MKILQEKQKMISLFRSRDIYYEPIFKKSFVI